MKRMELHGFYIYCNFAVVKNEPENVFMKRLTLLLLVMIAVVGKAENEADAKQWCATWAAAPQLAAEKEMPADGGLNNCSVRQIIHVSAGGEVIRLRLSNRHSTEPVVIKSVYIADAGEMEAIERKTAKYVTFDKHKNVTLEQKSETTSDPIKFHLKPLQRLSITINYVSSPKEATAHLGSRTTSYILKGESKPKSDFSQAAHIDHWYNIAAVDVYDEAKDVIAVIGNSITDGRGSTTNQQNRWTDIFAEQLHKSDASKAVLNLGIGGNCVIRYGLGEPAVKRFKADILEQSGVKKVILFEGVNDIGGSKGNSEAVAAELIKTLESMVLQAKERGLKVYGATITPFGKSFYWSNFHEAARQEVNEWIRKADCFDGVIDFDKLMSDPADARALQEAMQEDWLHPNAAGYRKMGEYAAEVIKQTD